MEKIPMKKLVIILTAAGLFFSFAIPAISADLKNEFLGIEWGADISKLKGFTVLNKKGDVVYYVNYDKSYQINNLDLPPVIYGSYLGKFFAAYIRLDSPELFDELNSYMNSKYGLSVIKVKSRQQVYRWKYEKIKIKLKGGYEGKKMKLAFYYTPLSDKLNEGQHEENEKSIQVLPVSKNKKYPAIPLLIF
jgi:hypothetical protein